MADRPDIRPILRRQLVEEQGLPEDLADELLDMGEAVGNRLREQREPGRTGDAG